MGTETALGILGEMPEWSIGPHSKCGVRATVPRVRIPVSPPKAKALKAPYKNKTTASLLVSGFFVRISCQGFRFCEDPAGRQGKSEHLRANPFLKREYIFIVRTGLPGMKGKTKRSTAEPPLSECCTEAAGRQGKNAVNPVCTKEKFFCAVIPTGISLL